MHSGQRWSRQQGTFELADTEGELAQQQLQQGALVVQVAGGCMHVLLPSLLQRTL